MESTVQTKPGGAEAGTCCGCCPPEPSKLTEATEPAIRLLVDRFYAKVRADDELGPVSTAPSPTGIRISPPCATSGRRSC
ncbi:hypothetical protein [Methyloceanibacter superfactus]|uniref:hypothetical protein n=1 Tax=Methyloceanibacter superfactus TaxID=1774969 RepID=UPI001FCD920D|nr:hypothetical protein [Methyloceanibacter superfactus]